MTDAEKIIQLLESIDRKLGALVDAAEKVEICAPAPMLSKDELARAVARAKREASDIWGL